MQRDQIESEHIIERYLTDQLSESETAEFEEFCQKNPDIYREIEATLRFREGLAALRDSGQLQTVMQVRSNRLWYSLAVAAAVLLATFGLWSWRDHTPSQTLQAALFSTAAGAHPVSASFVLITQRGAQSQNTLRLSNQAGTVALKLMPSDFAVDGRYDVTLRTRNSTGSNRSIGRIDDLKPAPDRFITLYLNPADLSPGEYEITVGRIGPRAQSDETDHFALSVTPTEAAARP
jgi:hypothetical protein